MCVWRGGGGGAHTWVQCPQRLEEAYWIFWSWSYSELLGTEIRFSARTTSTLNWWAISLAPLKAFKMIYASHDMLWLDALWLGVGSFSKCHLPTSPTSYSSPCLNTPLLPESSGLFAFTCSSIFFNLLKSNSNRTFSMKAFQFPLPLNHLL